MARGRLRISAHYVIAAAPARAGRMDFGRVGLCRRATAIDRIGSGRRTLLVWAVCLIALVSACRRGPAPQTDTPSVPTAPYVGTLPIGFPAPRVPIDNPMSAAKIELGRHLFYDPRLSGPGTQACATCHRQELAFTDGRGRALGASGELHPRSAMSLTNVAYSPRLGWSDPSLDSLEAQMRVPLFNETPVEMGLQGRVDEVMQRLATSEPYPRLFAAAFPGDPAPIQLENVMRAIATFERTLVSGSSAYDRMLFLDDRSALSASALRGMRRFFSDELACARCHSGLHFAGPQAAAPSASQAAVVVGFEPRDGRESDGTLRAPPLPDATLLQSALFHNTALYDIDGSGAYPPPNEGLFRVTRAPADMGRFRVPTLRNIAVTAPYMHDGSVATLEEVIAHYAAGGRAFRSPLRSPELRGFTLSTTDVEDLVAFLNSLTDEAFLRDPKLADPFAAKAEAEARALER